MPLCPWCVACRSDLSVLFPCLSKTGWSAVGYPSSFNKCTRTCSPGDVSFPAPRANGKRDVSVSPENGLQAGDCRVRQWDDGFVSSTCWPRNASSSSKTWVAGCCGESLLSPALTVCWLLAEQRGCKSQASLTCRSGLTSGCRVVHRQLRLPDVYPGDVFALPGRHGAGGIRHGLQGGLYRRHCWLTRQKTPGAMSASGFSDPTVSLLKEVCPNYCPS
ncbi:hypothetical protein QBC34DRAFT_405626 [Podospora aff. communis PSN243]|uniref:Uncharacterized protein n=1 Tax=Podospora aff. communis PSN243 TaxID=3040156 RepID=A0AAV9GMX8_9PEZI|nr:hypothetical protein QBC34DRAFT_405626 [Podospora aff. communis PSN243]